MHRGSDPGATNILHYFFISIPGAFFYNILSSFSIQRSNCCFQQKIRNGAFSNGVLYTFAINYKLFDSMRLTEEDRYSHLYMAIMELPEELRVLVTLYYLEGFSQKEISEALDIPDGTIKSRLSRAREFLKVQLSEEEKRPATEKNSKRSKRITGRGKMSC